MEVSGKDFIADTGDGFSLFFGKDSQVMIGISGCFFQQGKSFYDFLRHGAFLSYLEIISGTLCLCAPELISRDAHLSHSISFYSVIHNFNIDADKFNQKTEYIKHQKPIGRKNVDFGGSDIDFGGLDVDFRGSDIDFGSSDVDFRGSDIDLGGLDVDFRGLDIDFGVP